MDWLNILKRGLVLIASSLSVTLLFALLNKYAIKPRKKDYIIRPSPIFVILGIIGTIGFSFLAYLVIRQKEEYLFIPLFPFLLSSLWLILRGALWKITIEEDGIVFRNTFGKTKKYLYSEITEIKDERLGFVVIVGKKKIGVDMFNSNFSELRAVLARNCQKELFGKRRSPKLSKRKRKKEKEKNTTMNSKKNT